MVLEHLFVLGLEVADTVATDLESQIPIAKFQINPKLQCSNWKVYCLNIRILEIDAYLEFVIWCLEFHLNSILSIECSG